MFCIFSTSFDGLLLLYKWDINIVLVRAPRNTSTHISQTHCCLYFLELFSSSEAYMDEMEHIQAILSDSQNPNLEEALAAIASSTVGPTPHSPDDGNLNLELTIDVPVPPCSDSTVTPSSCFGPEERALLNEVHHMVKV
ncbi:hypothetical protein PIB30_092732 [Stylosanthes scabra]|uniref:Uncharacterized protein n=1 Tax=Stylosanthes scabra TaxID=79078 RepID=A0ABU6ZTJ7_9FABA|nr:hypothetical protein [Stylosanthes scabra]